MNQLPGPRVGRLTEDGYYEVPNGKLAAVVTSLEMFARAAPRPEPAIAPWTLERIADPERYRTVFRRVGADYAWASRLELSDGELSGVVRHPAVEISTLRQGGRDEGLLELDFRLAGECELTFFGVTRGLVGSGAARWLMNRALARAWSQPISRFWVHTCTLDHPSAVPFYLRSGFVAYRRDVEIFADPRLCGVLPPGAAPDIPRITF